MDLFKMHQRPSTQGEQEEYHVCILGFEFIDKVYCNILQLALPSLTSWSQECCFRAIENFAEGTQHETWTPV
jgi:hypothetical protein